MCININFITFRLRSTLATLLELFHSCCLLNIKQGQMILASVASVKWNAPLMTQIDTNGRH